MWSAYRNVLLRPRKLSSIANIKSITSNVKTESETISPLEGIRILDLTRIIAGPYCTMILGDLGAEVIKIERPGTGDEARKWGPPFVGDTAEACYFLSVNRNKKSICVNLKAKSGQKLIHKLAEQSDVFIENYVPGKLDELQLGYEQMKAVAPHLIYCSVTGYGSEGPYRKRPGYDVIAASIGGFLHITGPQDGEPVKAGVAMTDLATGLYAHGAIMAALIKRARTGLGQKIDCSLLASQIATLINIGSNYLNTGQEAKRWGTSHESIVPYQAFPTKDGYFTVGAGSEVQFADFCKRLGQPDLANNSKYLTNKDRIKNRKELTNILLPIFALKTNAEWSKIFEGSPSPYGPVNSLQQAFDDPQVKALKLVREVEHPIAGPIKVVGPAVTYSQGGNDVRGPPPALGQHTDQVLKDVLGYNEDQINQLRTDKVIQ